MARGILEVRCTRAGEVDSVGLARAPPWFMKVRYGGGARNVHVLLHEQHCSNTACFCIRSSFQLVLFFQVVWQVRMELMAVEQTTCAPPWIHSSTNTISNHIIKLDYMELCLARLATFSFLDESRTSISRESLVPFARHLEPLCS